MRRRLSSSLDHELQKLWDHAHLQCPVPHYFCVPHFLLRHLELRWSQHLGRRWAFQWNRTCHQSVQFPRLQLLEWLQHCEGNFYYYVSIIKNTEYFLLINVPPGNKTAGQFSLNLPHSDFSKIDESKFVHVQQKASSVEANGIATHKRFNILKN